MAALLKARSRFLPALLPGKTASRYSPFTLFSILPCLEKKGEVPFSPQ